MPRIAAEHNNAVRQQHRLFNVVRNDKDRLSRNCLILPKLQQFAAQILCRQHIQSREWFVHEQDLWFDHQGACKANPLPHPAR